MSSTEKKATPIIARLEKKNAAERSDQEVSGRVRSRRAQNNQSPKKSNAATLRRIASRLAYYIESIGGSMFSPRLLALQQKQQ